jgi:hypothetical protein
MFGTAKLSKPASTDIMSIAKDVSKTINIEELMKMVWTLDSSSSCKIWFLNVSKDIQSRIDSGEVNQEQLMKRGDRSTWQSRRWRWSLKVHDEDDGGGGIAEMMKMMVVRVSTNRRRRLCCTCFRSPPRPPRPNSTVSVSR